MSVNVKQKNNVQKPYNPLGKLGQNLQKEALTNIKVIKKASHIIPQNPGFKSNFEAKVKSIIPKENNENDKNKGNISSRNSDGVKKKILFEDYKMTSETKDNSTHKTEDVEMEGCYLENKIQKIISKKEERQAQGQALTSRNHVGRTKKFSLSSINNTSHSPDSIDIALNSNISLNLKNLKINQELKPSFSNQELRRVLSYQIDSDYGANILNELLEKEIINDNSLFNHQVSERMRMRMVDWMIEVLANYKCDNMTFFESINLMDRYFKKSNKALNPQDLHLIGVTSMYLASKFVDIYPLRIRTVYEKISHKKLSMTEIIKKETEIAELLDYNLGCPNTWDFINIFIQELFYSKANDYQINNIQLVKEYLKKDEDNLKHEKVDADEKKFLRSYSESLMTLLKHVAIYLAKMNCHDYQLLSKKPSLLAASTIFVALKICEQINKEEYVNDIITSKLSKISKIAESDIIKCAQKILYNAQNFEVIFSGLENLKRVHFNAIIELKQTK